MNKLGVLAMPIPGPTNRLRWILIPRIHLESAYLSVLDCALTCKKLIKECGADVNKHGLARVSRDGWKPRWMHKQLWLCWHTWAHEPVEVDIKAKVLRSRS